jgi:hypothetical protein
MAILLYNVPWIGFAKHNTRYTTNSHFLAFIEGNQADTSPGCIQVYPPTELCNHLLHINVLVFNYTTLKFDKDLSRFVRCLIP